MSQASDSKVATLAIPNEPTVEAMIAELSRSGQLPKEPVDEIRVITRPPWLFSLLVLAMVGLVAVFTILSGGLALGMRDLVEAIIEHRYAEAHPPPPPLPKADDLLEADVFTQALREFPQHVARIYAIRAQARLEHQDAAGAERDFREAGERTRVPLGPTERLGWAQALMALDRRGDAQDVLYALRLDDLTEEQRSLAVDLLARCRAAPVLPIVEDSVEAPERPMSPVAPANSNHLHP